MTCEICDTATATMWVEGPATGVISAFRDDTDWDYVFYPKRTDSHKPVLSCNDCGPQLGYKILAPLEATTPR